MTTGANPHPSGWVARRLHDVTLRIQDGTHFSPKPGGFEHKYITSRNIGAGYLKLEAVEMITADEHRKIYRRCNVRFGDLLLTKDGANTGNAALSTFHEEVSLLSSVAFIRADRRQALEEYLLQYLLSDPGRKQITDAMSGNAITRLTLGKINDLSVPLPPVPEQRAIATALATLDEQVTTLQQLERKLQSVKQAMVQQLLAGTRRLPGFEGPWCTKRFDALAAPARERVDPRRVAPRTSLVELEHIGSGTGELVDAASARDAVSLKAVFKPGDVLFGKLRAYLRKFWLADRAGICSTEIWALRPTKAVLAPYLRYLVETSRFLEVAAGGYGTHMPRADWNLLRSLEVDVPPIAEQRAIASALDDVDREAALLRRRAAKATSIKHGMAQELLTGRTRLLVGEAAG